jgi:arsenate reductase (thioredoxin)
MTRVLFLCVHNSARSQMAEAMLRAWGGGRYEAASGGSVATEVRPLAIRAMAEIGIDLAGQTSKTTDAFAGEAFDYAVTVCDESREAGPYFPGAATQLHWAFDDPSAATGTEDERLAVFRRVRDEIGARIRSELLDAS